VTGFYQLALPPWKIFIDDWPFKERRPDKSPMAAPLLPIPWELGPLLEIKESTIGRAES